MIEEPFVQSVEVEGDWERGYTSARAHFSDLMERAAASILNKENTIEGLLAKLAMYEYALEQAERHHCPECGCNCFGPR